MPLDFPERPVLQQLAILLDVDGTILDIAPRPQDVRVPDSLRRTLSVLCERLDGALALVSGRRLSDLDAIFAPLRLPAIGAHGAEMRVTANGEVVVNRAGPLDPQLRQAVKDAAARHPGVIVEDKEFSIALHFRSVLEQGIALSHDVRRACKAWGDRSIGLLAGKAVIEVKSSGFNKGKAVRELMAHRPFAGRVPVFIGDDITDEDAFAVMPEFGGRAMSVGRKLAGIDEVFHSPAEVRKWLQELAGEAVTP